uniref:Uncharacterized protein n=1 Tax=Panagrolaimus sp. JU765 TaxID=591449 RepID=A0AC34PVJ6_9BILA
MKGVFEGKFYEATQFISQLEITLKGYPDLKADDNFSTFLDHFPVVEMLKIEDDPWSEKSRTAMLRILAEKTEVWQLSFIHFDYESSLEDLKFFLQNATFLDGTKILLKTRLKDIIQMITFFGNWRLKTVYTLPGSINCPRSAVLLNENIKIIPKENNGSLTGIYLIPDILDHYPEHTWANHDWNYSFNIRIGI